MKGVISLNSHATDEEILHHVREEELLLFFLSCANLDEAQAIIPLVDRIRRILNEQLYEPFVVSIASFPPEDRNKAATFFEELHIATVALPYERFIGAVFE
jgi:hypothetical protein